jgi:hypothetical protein
LEYLKRNFLSRQTVLSKPINKNRGRMSLLCVKSQTSWRRGRRKKEEKDEEVERETL